ncbi:hypothetical protein TcasGA2_TC014964 [Tribolium castaneum]|uniref:Uncharacterized protein n=1 Tax=Tribolium castaneum TaxID=7070 RepID=D2A3Q2_TRICA|nr:hypothetical protein TcasGA2_TC014964 [Tribolium castaneum]
MAVNLADQILSSRSQFIKHLREDLAKTEQTIFSVTNQLDELKLTSENVRTLGKKVEHQSLIPLGANIYVNGLITHTGEYFLDKVAFPESYSVVETLDNTIKLLETRIKTQSELLKKGEDSRTQISERIRLLEDGDGNDDLPKEIVSDRGVALKVGDYYEIVEFEN